ncbi:MAG: NAD(+) synthetase, partial [Gemmatimonadota bacterium]|nr:NAD(+) synthetase [Gemmatimonadota bacterium]
MGRQRDPRAVVESLTGWLREKLEASGSAGVAFGLSGGIDSAVVCG